MRLMFPMLLVLASMATGVFAQDATQRLRSLEQRMDRMESELQRRRPTLADSRVQRWVQAVADLFSRRGTRDSLELLALEHERMELQLQDWRNQERIAVEREIAALLPAGSEVGEGLPASLLDRAQRLVRTPAGLADLRRFQELLLQLRAAKALLERPPDASAARKARELEALAIDATRFPGLEADRQKLIVALDGYCDRTSQLAKVIRTVPEGRNEADRILYLARYQAPQYPYLQQQMERAGRDPRFRLVEKGCP
jgi:hypothetical protein